MKNWISNLLANIIGVVILGIPAILILLTIIKTIDPALIANTLLRLGLKKEKTEFVIETQNEQIMGSSGLEKQGEQLIGKTFYYDYFTFLPDGTNEYCQNNTPGSITFTSDEVRRDGTRYKIISINERGSVTIHNSVEVITYTLMEDYEPPIIRMFLHSKMKSMYFYTTKTIKNK